jgi:hypothetical protein
MFVGSILNLLNEYTEMVNNMIFNTGTSVKDSTLNEKMYVKCIIKKKIFARMKVMEKKQLDKLSEIYYV